MRQDLTSVREAARALGVSHSTISRQVASGIIPNRGTAERPLIDVEEARAARAAHLYEGRQGSHAGRMVGDDHVAEDGPEAPAQAPDYRRARTAGEIYRAKLAELDYFERVGKLIDQAEVSAALFTAARVLRDKLQALAGRLAGELATVSDPAVVRTTLDAAFRGLLEDLAKSFAEAAAEPAATEDADVAA